MAEEKEQLRIEAELDTSKLKKDAQQGMQSVVNEEKRLEQQTRQTSRAIDNMGSSLNKASRQGTQALRQVGQEADRTAQKVANIDKSVKQLSLGRALGIASQFASSDIGKELGSAIGNSLGMSSDAQSLAGAGIQGALQGAAMGGGTAASIPLALVMAGARLYTAAQEQEKAASALIKSAEVRQAFNRERANDFDNALEKQKADKVLNSTLTNMLNAGNYTGAMDLVNAERIKAQAEFDKANKGIHNSKIQMDATPIEQRGALYKSFDDYLNRAKTAQDRLNYLDNLDKQIQATADQDWIKSVENDKKIRLKSLSDAESPLQKRLETTFSMGENYKLSDSLTRVGGTSGYGVQMNGVANNVKTITATLKDILAELKEQKTQVEAGIF